MVVRWKVPSVLFAFVCVFLACISPGCTGSLPTRREVTIGFHCESCINGYCYNETCLCRPGWKGGHCTGDADECAEGRHHCDSRFGSCTNTFGSYKCTCQEGWEGDGFTCEAPGFDYSCTSISLDLTDDTVYGPITVDGGLPYFGQKYDQLYVSPNGYLSLGKTFSKANPFADGTFPAYTPIIAPYWTDLDAPSGTQGGLCVHVYSESKPDENKAQVFGQVKTDIAEWRGVTFTPVFVLVVTWEKALSYPAHMFNESQSISFQVVLATDGERSFLLYDYGSGVMRWGEDAKWDNHPILLGYSDGSVEGTRLNVSDIYRPDLGSNIDTPGKYLFDVGLTAAGLECLLWANTPKELVSPACPCAHAAIELDFTYRHVSDGCYALRSTDPSIGAEFAPCCYESGSGVLLATQAVLEETNRNGDTLIYPAYLPAYQECCINSDLCHLFYAFYDNSKLTDAYPGYTCENYSHPLFSMVSGYMTYKTWARQGISYPTIGQFVLVDLDNGTFSLQMRTGQQVSDLTENLDVTVPIAFAAKDYDSDRFEVRWTADADAVIHIAGQPVGTMRTLPVGEPKWYNGVSIERLHATEPYHTEDVVVWFKATEIAFRIHQLLGRLSIIVAMPTASKDRSTRGLLGLTDEGTYVLRDETATLDRMELIRDWEVTADESLFTQSIDETIDQDFVVPQFLIPTVIDTHAQIDLDAGIYWTAQTYSARHIHSSNFSWATGREEDFFENVFYNVYDDGFGGDFIPSPPATIRVVTGQSIALALKVSNEHQEKVHVHVHTNIPDTYGFAEEGRPWIFDRTFEWTPTAAVMDSGDLYLMFFAVDNYGVGTYYWPQLEVCACMNGATCSFDYLSTEQHHFNGAKFYQATCECTEGYKGRFCSEAKGDCQPDPCYFDNTCTLVVGPPVGHQCAPCPDGMIGNGETFCAGGTENGTVVVCPDGFSLQEDKTCADINECDVKSGKCTKEGEECINTAGSYRCQCSFMYVPRTRGSSVPCVRAPHRFYAEVTFAVMKTADGYVPFSSEMTIVGSELFNLIYDSIYPLISSTFSDMGFATVRLAEVTNSSSQQIVALAKIYFREGITLEKLDQYVDYELYSENLIDANLTVKGWDQCEKQEDNLCDFATTDCEMEEGHFTCFCQEGFRNMSPENRCEDVCLNNFCQNEGACVPNGHTYQCNCEESWSGKNCTIKVEKQTDYQAMSKSLGVALGVVSGILLIVLLGALFRGIVGRKRKRNDSNNGMDRSGSGKVYTLRDAVAKLELNVPCDLNQAPDGKNDTTRDAISPEMTRKADKEDSIDSTDVMEPSAPPV